MSDGASELQVEMYADYHQVYIKPLDAEALFEAELAGDLLCPAGNGRSLIVQTGCAMGPVRIEVRVSESEPTASAEGTWEIVEQVTIEVSEPLILCSPIAVDTVYEFDVTTVSGPGIYNVRCQARGRELSYDLVVDEAEEDYLLEFWPAASTGERLPGAAAKRT